MTEVSNNNYCQGCQEDFGKNDSNCYHKSEKFTNLFYEDSSQIWKECETSNNNFTCSICPKGTYINDSFLHICEKCKFGEYSDNEDSNNCEKCPRNYYSDIIGAIKCKKCDEGYISFPGSYECFFDCPPGYYPVGNKCFPCQPGFYSPGSIDKCLECNPGTYSDEEKMNKCINCKPGQYNTENKGTTCFNCSIGYFSPFEKSISCEECEENKYSLSGFSKCISCGEIIPYCNNCIKEVICLECNNTAISGFNNCTICENEYDWIFTGEYCKLITVCPKYFYKDKNNKNKIHCIDNVEDCPEDMDYLDLDSNECKNITDRELLYSNCKVKEKKMSN